MNDATAPTTSPSPGRSAAASFILRSHRIRLFELLPWLIAIAVYYYFPGYRGFTTKLLVFMLFALSVDLVVGYAGIVTLGHAAFFGTGAYVAALLGINGWNEPVSALLVAAMAAGLLALVSGWILLRTHGLTLLMLTLAIALMLFELATEMDHITGGFDGLNFSAGAILGLVSFDALFYTTNYWYALFFLFVCFVFVRCVVHSPFGRSLVGVREHPKRMTAVGAPVHGRLVTVYVISGAIAGIAGAVFAQVQGNVTPEVYAFELSGEILIMVILGGLGRLYGAFIGAALFMILQQFTETVLGTDLPWWMLIVGVALVLTVMFAPRGLLGIGEDARRLLFGKRS